jgi:ribonuclease P protein component
MTAIAEKPKNNFGFPAFRRLKNAQEFQLVYQRGQRFRFSHLALSVMDNGKIMPRLGISVSKKHVRSAVDRNRIRRLIRESFRLHQHTIPAADYAITLSAPLTPMPQRIAAFRERLGQIWKEAALVKVNVDVVGWRGWRRSA